MSLLFGTSAMTSSMDESCICRRRASGGLAGFRGQMGRRMGSDEAIAGIGCPFPSSPIRQTLRLRSTRKDRAMPIARANGIDIAYETVGSQDHPTILLVMGLGAQL